MRSYLRARFRLESFQVDDLLQDFVLEKVLSRGLFQKADQNRGRFRILLVHALTRHVISAFRQARALKRVSAEAALPLSVLSERDLARWAAQARQGLDLAFARAVFREAVEAMRAACLVSGRLELWEVFRARVLAPLEEGTEPDSLIELQRQLGFANPAQVSNTLATAKRMFARLFRRTVGRYVADEDEVEEEVRALKEILARGENG